MFTLGYSFRPWSAARAIADGGIILQYIRDTAAEYGIDAKIRFNHTVKCASWSSLDAIWSVEVERGPDKTAARFTCNFLFVCSGYYSYAGGYAPIFPGREQFTGQIVHPQKWPQDLDYAGKRIIVIGSGATAVTLVPALARSAAQVTMLQRSPTYVLSLPHEDRLADFLRRYLPRRLSFTLIRWRNILTGIYFFRICKRSPERLKRWLVKQVQNALGPAYDVTKHFAPRYDPWDQRMCFVPDGDLFAAISSGNASVVTDEIEAFTKTGIQLRSGASLDADIIVTATGLNLVALGGMQISVDGRNIDPAKTMSYKGTMYSGIPNLASVYGYTNASWTLKCELTCDYVCRLLNHMNKRGKQICVPHNDDPSVSAEPWLNLNSGYIQRMADKLPKQGSKMPWKLHQNYVLDILSLKLGPLEDGVMRFPSARDGA
jgi:cation diffusion facilitator CzcD-associated flavoprotein CzcO